ncbi:MAG: methyltransferase domain-containing protein, partial [Clostridium sp.]
KTGLLDPIFTPGNYEDDDLSLKIINAGYNLLLCKDTFIHHFGSVSFNKDLNAYSMYLTMNRMKLNSKWGFDVNSKNYAKFDLIEMMKCSLKKEINVLEVNCGIGVTLFEIKNRFKNANLYGLESNENIAKVCNGICNISVGDICDISKKYNENFFDYIILGDVLEHLINPWEELRSMSRCLKANGLIITAIPNINYIGIISELIKGKFTYLSEGILNQDHLRFFTLEEINKLFNTSGYNITNIGKYEAVISEEEEKLITGLCELCGDSNKDEYKNVQYRITARKIIDKSRYDNENMIKLKYMIMRVDNGFEEKETFDKIFELYEDGYFARDLNYLISNNVINKGLVLSKIIGQIMSRGLNYILEDLEGLGYE